MRMSAYPSTSRIERELTPEEEILNEWEFRVFDDDRYIYCNVQTGEWAKSQPIHEFQIYADGTRISKVDGREFAIKYAIGEKLRHPDCNIIVISGFTGEIIFEAKNLTITGEGFSFRV